MLYCPKCKTEYRDGFNTCSDCGEVLVEKVEKTKPIEVEADANTGYVDDLEDETLLVSILDPVEYSYVTSMLDQEGISFVIKVDGITQYLRVLTGISFKGKDIYVGKADAIKAMEIVDSAKFELPEDEDVEE